MIITYRMANRDRYGCLSESVEMCGRFRSSDHFKTFRKIEDSYNRVVTSIVSVVHEEH